MKKTASILLSLLFFTSCATANITPSKPGDSLLSCQQIALEIEEMNDIVGDTQKSNIAADLANVGTGAAYTAISLGQAVPFLGQAVSAVGGVSGMTKSQNEKVRQQAEMRRSTLNGLYVGKNCDAELAALNEQLVKEQASVVSAKLQTEANTAAAKAQS